MIMKKCIFLLLALLCLMACSKDEQGFGEDVKVPEVIKEVLVVDPTKVSPLTANLEVETDIEVKVSVLIKGQDNNDLRHDFGNYSKFHTIPVLGLYSDYKNHVVITLTSKSGREVQLEKMITTDPLPDWIELKSFSPQLHDPDKMSDDFIMMHLGCSDGLSWRNGAYPVMIDKYGKIRWIYFSGINSIFKRLENGHYLIDKEPTGLWEIDLLGVVYGHWDIPEGVHHDAVETPDNHILFLSASQGSTDDAVIELSRENGKYIHNWDFRKILDSDRPQAPTNGLGEDWLHLNGIDFQEKDNSFIISGRNQSVVAKIDRSTGKLKWILANHNHWGNDLKKYLLTPVGNDFEWQWGQHAPMINPKDPSKILIFDNGCDRSYTNPVPAAQNYSRVVEYKINESAMTVEQVWQFGKEYGGELYSSYISNVRYLNNGNVFICYGGLTKNSSGVAVDFESSDICNSVRILEIIPSTKEVVWDLKLEGKENKKMGYRSYRAYKINMYN